jgi:hypothetical protein
LRLLRHALHLTCFTAGFLSLGLLAGSLSPGPEIDIISPKLAHLHAHGADYDTLFLGSSRIYHQLDPQRFDALLAGAGIHTHSFNLGADELRPPEDACVLERALAKRQAPLRWVLLEAAAINFTMDADFKKTLRARYWHDAPRMRLLLDRYLLGDGPYGKQGARRSGELLSEFPRLLDHLRLFAARAIGDGNGAHLVKNALTDSNETHSSDRSLGARTDGFAPEPPGSMPAELLPKYRRELAQRRRRPARPSYSDPSSQRLLQHIRQLVAEHGGELILIVPPTTNERVFTPDPAFGPPPRVLDFSSLEKYPELFDPAFRHDIDHLNPDGAARFTSLIAEALAR